MVTSVTPMVCITVAFWLGRGTVTCACVALARTTRHRIAPMETKLFQGLISVLLVVESGCNDISKLLKSLRRLTRWNFALSDDARYQVETVREIQKFAPISITKP